MEEFTNSHLTRQLDLIPVACLNKPIHIIGAGAIGSLAALSLVKMGCTDLTVYDHDKVSIENMSCQGYGFSNIGQPKVDALAAIIKEFTGKDIKAVQGRWTPEVPLRGIVIGCADSMLVRKELAAACAADYRVEFFIDSRMGAESALLYCMNMQDHKDCTAYANSLYEDKDSVQEKCTAKATIYTANLLAGLLVKTVKNLLTRQDYPRVTMWNIAENQMTVFTKERNGGFREIQPKSN